MNIETIQIEDEQAELFRPESATTTEQAAWLVENGFNFIPAENDGPGVWLKGGPELIRKLSERNANW